jgi:hypothetical protein
MGSSILQCVVGGRLQGSLAAVPIWAPARDRPTPDTCPSGANEQRSTNQRPYCTSYVESIRPICSATTCIKAFLAHPNLIPNHHLPLPCILPQQTAFAPSSSGTLSSPPSMPSCPRTPPSSCERCVLCSFPERLSDRVHRRLSSRRLVRVLGQGSQCRLTSCTGPKVNSVEKLAELRRAGVNIGAASTFCYSGPL